MGRNNYIVHLSADSTLKQLIDLYGILEIRHVSTDIFFDLVESIINQQLSNKAAATIFGRFKKLFPNESFSAEIIIPIEDETIRKTGISYSKIKYIKGLSQAVITGELDLPSLPNFSDEEVMKELTKIKGIGRWTAEMILMFSLNRPDVFSVGDVGLRNAINKLYGISQNNLTAIIALSQTWKPYRTYASRYLWKCLE